MPPIPTTPRDAATGNDEIAALADGKPKRLDHRRVEDAEVQVRGGDTMRAEPAQSDDATAVSASASKAAMPLLK